MTVAIAGGISQARSLDLIQQSFRQFAAPLWCPEAEDIPLVMPTHQRRTLHLPNLEHSRLTLAWLGPGIEHIETASGLDLLSVLLGGGATARLVRELREERQLVQDIDSSFSLQQACSMLSISIWLESAQLDEVENIVCDRIHTLTEHPPSQAEFSRCQRLLLNDYAFATETPGQIAGLYGYYATIAEPSLAMAYPEHVRSHSPESLQQIARQYLMTQRCVVIVLKPQHSPESAP